MQPAFGKECHRVICSNYKVCNSWLSYWISVPGDWLHNEATTRENAVIQSFSLVWKWRIHTVLWHRRVQHSRESIQSLRRCWVTRTQSPATDTWEPCSWELQGGIRAQKLLWGPGIVVSLRPVLSRHRTSEKTWNRTWNFETACECFIWAAQKHICAEVWDCVSFTAWLLYVIGVVCYSKELWLSGTWYLLLGAFINFTSRRDSES